MISSGPLWQAEAVCLPGEVSWGCTLTQGLRSCPVGLRTHRGLQITRKWSVPCGDNEGKAQVRMQGSCGCREGVEGSSGRWLTESQEAKGYIVSQRCLWGPVHRTQHICTEVMCVSFGTNDVTHLLECYIPHGVLQHTATYRLPVESQRIRIPHDLWALTH